MSTGQDLGYYEVNDYSSRHSSNANQRNQDSHNDSHNGSMNGGSYNGSYKTANAQSDSYNGSYPKNGPNNGRAYSDNSRSYANNGPNNGPNKPPMNQQKRGQRKPSRNENEMESLKENWDLHKHPQRIFHGEMVQFTSPDIQRIDGNGYEPSYTQYKGGVGFLHVTNPSTGEMENVFFHCATFKNYWNECKADLPIQGSNPCCIKTWYLGKNKTLAQAIAEEGRVAVTVKLTVKYHPKHGNEVIAKQIKIPKSKLGNLIKRYTPCQVHDASGLKQWHK